MFAENRILSRLGHIAIDLQFGIMHDTLSGPHNLSTEARLHLHLQFLFPSYAHLQYS